MENIQSQSSLILLQTFWYTEYNIYIYINPFIHELFGQPSYMYTYLVLYKFTYKPNALTEKQDWGSNLFKLVLRNIDNKLVII